MKREPPRPRSAYRHFLPLQTRWHDNDVYGHVNNVVYYAYFDTVVNEYLVRAAGLDVERGDVIGLVVETSCRYFAPVSFPEALEGALRVAAVGNSSVQYDIGIFRVGDNAAVAEGRFVHVYVDRTTRRPTPLPPHFRRALEAIAVAPSA